LVLFSFFALEVLGSMKCDCAELLQLALKYIQDNDVLHGAAHAFVVVFGVGDVGAVPCVWCALLPLDEKNVSSGYSEW
jgi:hypothetical protein